MSTSHEVDRRARHKRRTREALETAALRLFAQRGFDATTVEDITAAADVSPRTFFRYFASKEDVVFAGLAERQEQVRAAFAARPVDEAAVPAVRAVLLDLAHEVGDDRDRDLLRARIAATSDSLAARSVRTQVAWEQVLTDGIATRLGVDPTLDLRPGVIAAATVGALRVALDRWVDGGGAEDLVDLVRRALDALEDVLA